ncbi:TolC family protein [Flavobacterium tegetincola]|uniref:TolC family protein n=1 Tax=Flavobacterium tegetincola TaxID=150172 RepID=UPI00041F68DF|nr:TolC family protein [Flavobacterium tegetincola]
MKYKLIQHTLATLFFFGTVSYSYSQAVLTVEDAVKIALENNFEIQIATNNSKIDATNVSLANAGILPNLDAVLTNSNSILDTKQTQADGSIRELNNAKNMNLSYGLALNWTVFDGFKMFAKHEQLKQIEQLGTTELQFTILNKVGDVMETYYQIVQQQEQLKVLDTTLVISQLRLNLAKNRYTIGKASKLEVLNAEVDCNTDNTNLLRQKELYSNTKTALNELLARDLTTEFLASEGVIIDKSLQYADLKTKVSSQNPQLQMQILNKRIAELSLKQIKGDRYPTIGLNTGYNFTRSESSLGFVSESTGNGLVYGVTARMNIFNGSLQNRNEKVAKISVENAGIYVEQQKNQLESQLLVAYTTYLTNIQLVELEDKNEKIAEQNLDITLEKFKIGTITTVEFRTAQLNYVNAKFHNNSAQFQAKISEIALKELAGNLDLN